MSTNCTQPDGDVLDLTAPAGGVTKGVPALIAGLFVIPADTAAATLPFRGKVGGVFTLTKLAGEGALAEGAPLFWDVANARVTIDASAGLPIGTVAVAAATGDTTCAVRLAGTSLAGRVHTVRKRFTIAQVNAGATLLPAIAGAKYRMLAASGISIGGAAGAVTTVDILATLAAGSRKLVAFAQASLTQSSVLKDGGAGAAVLADGASYTANDAGTAVTVGKTGADVTVATHIDVALTYSIE